jgi:LysM repeat protein
LKKSGFIILSLCISLLAFKSVAHFSSPHPLARVSTTQTAMSSRELINQLMKGVENVKTLKYDLKITERIDGQYKNYGSSIKLQRSPRKLYIYVKGAEVLWEEGKNNGDALVNPGAFPYINLNLSPFGSLMTSDQHHTIYEIGFDYFKGIIEYTITQIGDRFDKCFLYGGEEKLNGRSAYKITILDNDFALVPYIVKKGESLITIARKLRLSEYMIKENNKKIKNYHDVKEGQEIIVPTAYAKMTIIYIDKVSFVPLLTRVYDDKGLFESYEYLNLQVNSKIADEEFTKGYKGYHF